MKLAILYDSKFGNTKTLAEFLAEKIGADNHDVRLFRTTESKPQDILAFQPEAILVGGPTHFGNPARTLGKYIKSLGKAGQETTIRKVAVFNCYSIKHVCEKIKSQVLKALPKVEIFEKSLPVKTDSQSGSSADVLLTDNWKEDATIFLSAFITFISQHFER